MAGLFSACSGSPTTTHLPLSTIQAPPPCADVRRPGTTCARPHLFFARAWQPHAAHARIRRDPPRRRRETSTSMCHVTTSDMKGRRRRRKGSPGGPEASGGSRCFRNCFCNAAVVSGIVSAISKFLQHGSCFCNAVVVSGIVSATRLLFQKLFLQCGRCFCNWFVVSGINVSGRRRARARS